MKIALTFVVGFVFVSIGSWAQEIHGILMSEQNEPVEFATVLLLNAADSALRKGVISDERGRYEFQNIQSGEYIIKVSMASYKPGFSERFQFTDGRKTVEPIVLANLVLDEVVITASKPLYERTADRTIINVENSVVNAGNSAWEILQKSPGVTVDNNEEITILGKQGILVYVNGKQSYLSGQDLASLLKGMPSSNLEKIEIITNPGSSFDASGNAGVISIHFKKNANEGVNSSVSLNGGAGWNVFYSPSINFNYRTKRTRLYGNYSYSDRDATDITMLKRRILVNNIGSLYDQSKQLENHDKEHSANLNVDYDLSSKHTIGGNVEGFFRDGSSLGSTASIISGALDRTISIDNSNARRLDNYSAGFFYGGKFGKNTNLTSSVDYLRYDISANELFDVVDFIASEGVGLFQPLRNLKNTGIDIFTYKIDFKTALNKNVALQAGLKRSDIQSINKVEFDSLINSAWKIDPSKTSDFNYDEIVNAGYFNITRSKANSVLNLGLRVEHTLSNGFSPTSDSLVHRDYVNLFPSIFYSYYLKKDEKQTEKLGFSYGRRIDRPAYQRLNPFTYFLDPLTFLIGNPFLRPQYTDKVEASYSTNKISLALGYSKTKDVMSFVTESKTDLSGVATTVNLDKLDNYSASISYQDQLTRKWSTFTFVSAFYSEYNSQYLGGRLRNSNFALRINTSNSIILPMGLKGEISGFFQTPVSYGISTIQSITSINAGLQRAFLNKKLTVKLNVNDVLNSNKSRGFIKYQNQDLDFFFRSLGSRVNLSMVYAFGNKNVRINSQSRSGATEESKRVIKE